MVPRKKVSNPPQKKAPVSHKTSLVKKDAQVTLSEQEAYPQPTTTFSIVGIGASAGGLEALESYFAAAPEKPGVAFVVVSHLDPNHTSILPDLIQRKTAMEVHQVADNMPVVPNQVFIIPPNKEMAILNGTLQLLEMSLPRRTNLPIDIFFRSLALDQRENAVGVILSGTGSDGSIGIRGIKGEGGLVMAQDPQSAKYDGMPVTAIATGLVDFILPPEKMVAQLLKYVSHQFQKPVASSSGIDMTMQAALQKIIVLLRAINGHDFSLYKKNTIVRRIERRMHVHQIDHIADYVRYLQDSDQEKSILFKDILIGVTSFFRDPEAFKHLKEKYFPDLFKGKPVDGFIRAWVPGCSTGEEAYSLAIIIQECMEAIGCHFTVQIFATDLDDEAINLARAGVYPDTISVDVSQKRLKRFFTQNENHYTIKKSIRDMVVFAQQNITKDPPFTKLDLLSCRNLLIYFDQELQQRLLPIFHYSLNPGGLLFLGSSETVGHSSDLFISVDKKWKIFSNHAGGGILPRELTFPPGRVSAEKPAAIHSQPQTTMSNTINPLHLLTTIIAQSDMSTCVVIDDQGNILYIHGRTGRYLEPAEGEAKLNILDMARPSLKSGLSRAIRKMASDRQEVITKGLQVGGKDDGLVKRFRAVIPDLIRNL